MLFFRLIVLFSSVATAFCLNTDSAASNTCAMTASKFRSVRKILSRPSPHWVGDGFKVYPVFGSSAFTEELSPLLMFDYAEPKKFPAKVGPPLGVGQHPHRGFETVTVAFQGEVEHKDSAGNSGVIKPGDVQWMTAGRGVIHQEYHSKEFTKGISSENIAVVSLPLDAKGDDVLGTARLIAGELGKTKGAANTFSPVQMWDVNLPRVGSEVDLPFPSNHNCIVFVRRGSIEVFSGEQGGMLKASSLGPQDVALMHLDGSDTLRLRVSEPDSSVMILGGEPINEPIAAQGPFVMNTYDEIQEAISDYRMGKMGK